MNLDRRLLAEARAVRLYLALTIGTGLLAGVATVLQAYCLSQVVGAAFLRGRSVGELIPLLSALLALIAARAGLVWTREAVAYRASGRVRVALRERLLAHLMKLGPAYAWGERTGEMANTAMEGVEALDSYFSQYLPNLALAALVPLTILLFVFPLDLVSGLVFLLTAPLIPLFMVLTGHLAEGLTKRQWESLSRLSAHFLDVIQGLTTLQLFGRSKEQSSTIARVSERFRDTTMGVLRVAFLSALALELLASISTAIVAVEVGLRLLYGTIPFEQAFFVLILAPEFYLPLRALGASFHSGMSGVAAAQRIFEVLETPPQDAETRRRGDAENIPVSPRPRVPASEKAFHIHFDDVHFAYDDGQRPALKGVSFQIGPGQRVALVGPSGSGKSTVANLLLRFVEPSRGQILVNGKPLGEMPADSWREQVAWVPQNPYLFNTTVAENIRHGRSDASLEDVARAAELAGAADFVRALPRGYDTVIGERGARLSGGEAQRIALARAFIKNAPILILDEAAANLDGEHEAIIQGTIYRLMQGRTVLIIAHRLSTVRQADQVVVLSDGQVVETGTHHTLLLQGGLYSQLVAARPARPSAISGQRPAFSFQQSAISTEFPHPDPLPGGEGNSRGAAPTHHSSLFTLHSLVRLLAPFKGHVALSVLLGVATVGSGIGLMATAAFVIASAALHPSVADLAVPIVGVRFFGISRGVFRYLERYVSHDVSFRLLARMRVWFYDTIEPLAPGRLAQHGSGDLLSRAVADVESLQQLYVRAVAPPAVALLIGLLMGAFMGAFDLSMAYSLAAFLLLSGVGVPLLADRLGRDLGRRMARVRSDLTVLVVDGMQGMADLVSFGQEERHLERVHELNRRWMAMQEKMSWIAGLHGGLGTVLANGGMWAALAVGIALVSEGRLEGVYLPVLALAALASFEAVAPLPLAFQHLGSCLEAARRLFEIEHEAVSSPRSVVSGQRSAISRQPSALRTITPTLSPWEREHRQGGHVGPPLLITHHPSLITDPRPHIIEVENLRFRYGPEETPALNGICFRLSEGQRLAIVGPSGSGKSTLVHLLLRFWEYQDGHIYLFGRELRHYRQEDVRKLVAVVSQRTHVFNATVRANLLLARPRATEEEMVGAARIAQLHRFVCSLPRGYDTWIGEQGVLLSGGERQRLAIARALLKDSPILILDEATANLDSLTEREVLNAISALMKGRTTLTVTHRLVGLEDAHEILVLRAGEIGERGRHHELLQAGGLYHRMWELQGQQLAVQVPGAPGAVLSVENRDPM